MELDPVDISVRLTIFCVHGFASDEENTEKKQVNQLQFYCKTKRIL